MLKQNNSTCKFSQHGKVFLEFFISLLDFYCTRKRSRHAFLILQRIEQQNKCCPIFLKSKHCISQTETEYGSLPSDRKILSFLPNYLLQKKLTILKDQKIVR